MHRVTAFVFLCAILDMASLTANAAVGRTPGQYVVSPSGSAQYTIPVWAPQGPRGIQPHIALTYNSQSSIGPLGVGWSLGGLGSIARCNKTTAQDTTGAAVTLAVTDAYCLNGNRLQLTSGSYGTAGSTYQTEIADFSNVTANGTAGNGPAYFSVQGRDGNTYLYGYADSVGGANSQVLATGSSTASQWLLSRITDRSGNSLVVNYVATNGTTLTGETVPDKILWTPVSAGATTFTYTMQFIYGTNVPQSSVFGYLAGTVYANNKLLTSIQILTGTTVVKDYFLAYQASATTGRKQLISVTECADTSQTSCLSPTTISYQSGSPGVSTTSNGALASTTSATQITTRYDVNGDGYPDLIYCNGPTVTMYVAFGSASGYGTAINTGIACGALIGKLTSGAQDVLLANNGGVWWYYSWNGTSFAGSSTGLALDPAGFAYQLADVNGDGFADLITLHQVLNPTTHLYALTVFSRLNTSSGAAVTFSSTQTTAFTGIGNSARLQTPDLQYGKLRRFDFNGDGLDDVVLNTLNGTTINTFEIISTGTGFTSSHIASVASASYVPVYFTNWNDDKCTDFVTANTLYVSGCNGTAAQTYSMPGTIVTALDWDGDGRTDILVVNGSTLGAYLSQGTGSPTLTSLSFTYDSSCTYLWMDANGDGLDDLGCISSAGAKPLSYFLHNGTADLATSFVDGYGNSANPSYGYLTQAGNLYTNLTDAPAAYANYIGPLFVVSQTTFSDPSSATGGTYSQTMSYSGAWISLQGRGFAGFEKVRSLDSRNNVTTAIGFRLDFPYTGMQVSEFDSLPGSTSSGTLNSTNTLSEILLAVTNRRYFPYVSNTTIQNFELDASPISTKSIDYTFDNFGNATTITQTLTDNTSNPTYSGHKWITTTTNTTDISVNQSADLAAWCLTMLTKTQVAYTSDLAGSLAVTRTKTFGLDTPTACRILSAVIEPNNNGGIYAITESLLYDSFGNVKKDTITGANVPAPTPATRIVALDWGTTGQFVHTITDPSNATTTYNYVNAASIAFGVPDNIQDANNLTTSWHYDEFGRKKDETASDNTVTKWSLTLCTAHCGWVSSQYQVAQTRYQADGSTVIRADSTYLDPIDRPTEALGPTVTGSTAIIQRQYNSLGLISQQSMPFLSSSTAFQATYAYDGLNRLIEIARPIQSTGPASCTTTPPLPSGCQATTITYTANKRVVKDPMSNQTTTIVDVNGWLRKITDGVGYAVTRAYDAAGGLTSVNDSVGNTLFGATYNYGLQPFVVATTDQDLGAWTYTIDSYGEQVGWKDAKLQTFSMTFDAMGRPLTRTDPVTTDDPGLFTQWQWGSTPANHNVGQLVMECTATGNVSSCSATQQYLETRDYDSFGRPKTRYITQTGNPGNDTGGVFQITNAYDANTGFLSTVTYPKSTAGVALTLQYAYQKGILQSVSDTTDTVGTCGTSCVLWTANAMNAFGEITQQTLGNGVVTNRAYDAVTSWLQAQTAGIGGGFALLNQSYLRDKNGNVIQRQQNNAPAVTESFNYDANNRLTCAALAATCSAPTLAYDGGVAGPGNLTSQAGVGTYTYPPAGQPRPHAVTSIAGTFNGVVNPSFQYDANGNMTNRASASRNITWSSYNYPLDITATDASGTEEVQFSYGPDRQRWKQVFTPATGPMETTYYVGGVMEVVFSGSNSDYRHYVRVNSEIVAVYSRKSSGVNTMNYMLTDHQAGVSEVVSSAGSTVVNEAYAAFGTRRNPVTWAGAPTAGDLTTIASTSRQGYTDQTWLGQSMGLNHMNGRVQDALLGRFLSPDPYVSDDNPQTMNRYSYVNNNPLSYVDPSGFNDCYVIVGFTRGTPGTANTDIPVTSGLPIVWSYPCGGNPGSSGGGPGSGGRNGGGGDPAANHPSNQTTPECKKLAKSLGLGSDYHAPSTTPVSTEKSSDDLGADGSGITLGGDFAIALRAGVGKGGSKVIGGRSVGASMAEIGSYINAIGWLGIGFSIYQAKDSYSHGDVAGVGLSGVDAGMGVAAFFPVTDVVALGYGITRVIEDVGLPLFEKEPESLLDKMGKLQQAGCL